MRRRPTRDEVKNPELLFRLVADMAAEIADLNTHVKAPAPPIPATEIRQADSILAGVTTPGGALVKLGIDPIATRKSNLAGLGAPTAADDNSRGYEVGSIWININAAPKTVWMLAASTTTAAEWIQLG